MPEGALLVVSIYDEPGRMLRAVRAQVRGIETNLKLANMAFSEFKETV
jgi:hypothetical protein